MATAERVNYYVQIQNLTDKSLKNTSELWLIEKDSPYIAKW